MLTQRHKLNVSVVHILYIIHQLVCHITIGQVLAIWSSAPGTSMNLICQHRPGVGLLLLSKIFLIMPLILAHVIYAGCSIRLYLGKEAIWVRLHDMWSTMLWHNCILVGRAFSNPWNKYSPGLAILHLLHAVYTSIPVVKIAYNTYRLCMRSPDRKAHACFTIFLGDMSPQQVIGMEISSFMEQMQIEIA